MVVRAHRCLCKRARITEIQCRGTTRIRTWRSDVCASQQKLPLFLNIQTLYPVGTRFKRERTDETMRTRPCLLSWVATISRCLAGAPFLGFRLPVTDLVLLFSSVKPIRSCSWAASPTPPPEISRGILEYEKCTRAPAGPATRGSLGGRNLDPIELPSQRPTGKVGVLALFLRFGFC